MNTPNALQTSQLLQLCSDDELTDLQRQLRDELVRRGLIAAPVDTVKLGVIREFPHPKAKGERVRLIGTAEPVTLVNHVYESGTVVTVAPLKGRYIHDPKTLEVVPVGT